MSKSNDVRARARKNLEALKGAMPEPPAIAGPDGGMPGAEAAGAMPPPAPGGPAETDPLLGGAMGEGEGEGEGEEEEEEGAEGGLGDIGLKSPGPNQFISGCANNKCGACLNCITRGEAGKGADDAIQGNISGEMLAALINGCVQTHVARAVSSINETLKGIGGKLSTLQDDVGLVIELGGETVGHALKSAMALNIVAKQPAAAPRARGVAVQNPPPITPEQAGAFQFTEAELYKAVYAGKLTTVGMQDLMNAGRLNRHVDVKAFDNVPNDLEEILKSL